MADPVGAAFFHFVVGQIIVIPQLLRDHAADVGEVFHRLLMYGREIAAGGEFVVAAFAGQNRPGASHAAAVEGGAVVFLAVAVEIVAADSTDLAEDPASDTRINYFYGWKG